MKEFRIKKNEAGQRFDKYLTKLLPCAPKSFLYRMLRKKNIVLNGGKAQGPEMIREGDLVRLFLADDTFDKFSKRPDTESSLSPENARLLNAVKPVFDFPVYADHDIMLINKPRGILSQKAGKDDASLNEFLVRWWLESGAGTEEDTETGRMPEMVVGSFDLPASSSVEETEPDWTQFAPELDENGEFHLNVEYIEAYGEDSVQDLIFYGDSRVVGMAYTTGGYHYVGKEGAGCDWMQGEGLSYLEDQMTQWPEADIVFCFGVNDPGSIEQYLQFYRSYTPLFPERRFWFLSVNPVYDALAAAGGFSAQNRLIDDFNVRLEEEFPEGYLDSCSYLREYGYNAPDGVHYDGATYYAIQDYCRREIMRRLEE